MSFVGDIIGDITGTNQAADAAKEGAALSAQATTEATEKNIDFQKWLWGEQKALTQPYADFGAGAIPQYQQEVAKGFGLDDMYQDPGFQFGLNQGIDAMDNSASAKGMSLSGPARKAYMRYGSDYGTTKFNEAFNRRQVGLDNLYRMIMTGSNAASGQATTGGQMGTQVSNAINTGGAANAQMYSDFGNISAQQAMAPFNTLMDVGGMYMFGKGAGAF